MSVHGYDEVKDKEHKKKKKKKKDDLDLDIKDLAGSDEWTNKQITAVLKSIASFEIERDDD